MKQSQKHYLARMAKVKELRDADAAEAPDMEKIEGLKSEIEELAKREAGPNPT